MDIEGTGTELKNRTLAYDCRHFPGDRSCNKHKEESVLCECEDYCPSDETLLLIKLDEMDDVLRTTSVLPVIMKVWPGIRITWITRQESVPLLENNPYVAEVIAYNADAFTQLFSRTFDRVVNLDAGKISSGLAALAKGKEKIGYTLNKNGYVTGTNAAAEEWLRMTVFHNSKRANQDCHELLCSLLGLPRGRAKYVFELTEEERKQGRGHLNTLGLDLSKSIIGIHTGGEGRWLLKQWKEERFVNLIIELRDEHNRDLQLVLLGGPLDRDLNKRIMAKARGITADAGCDNDLRHLAGIVNCCSAVLSGDSLTLDIALALRRRVIVLFRPTNSAEPDLFGLGEKVVPPLDCIGCYNRACSHTPACMESLSVDMIKNTTLRQLSEAAKTSVLSGVKPLVKNLDACAS